MKKAVINNISNLILKYNNYNEEEKERLMYGLEGLYLTITKFIIIFLLALVLNTIKETILTLLVFNIIRYFGFGFHAEKSYQCLLTSVFFFVILPFIFSFIVLNTLYITLIYILSLISFLLFAPADTAKRPLKYKRLRIIRKIITMIIATFYYFISIKVEYTLSIPFIVSLIIQSIIVNPIFYKLFKQPYNNYKMY